MLINQQTKIATLIRQHPDALETIVTLSPDFKKLRNPVLRKLMAGRTSIAMAAKIGGCKPEDFYERLKPLGFEVDPQTTEAETTTGEIRFVPDFLKALRQEDLIPLDVRPMLTSGQDPLKHILQQVKQLRTGQVLKIINSFEPTPLIALLEKQGFQCYVDHVDANRKDTYFYKDERARAADPIIAEPEPAGAGWDEALRQFEGKLQTIEVRHLEMPQPMMQILAALEKLPAGHALYVLHKRIPVFLLTELKERHFEYRIREIAEGEVHLLIFYAQ